MDLLFFDIECCDGKHICEFGYVLTDMQFNVIEREVITINPDMPFSLTGRADGRDFELYFSNAKYCMSPLFPVYHQRIKSLIETSDRLIFGHAIDNDAKFLRTACDRYGLDPISFRFCDSQKVFDVELKSEKNVSLEEAVEKLELPKPEFFHRSDCDAEATMTVTKALCEKLEISPADIPVQCEYCVGSIENGVITLNNERFKWEKILMEAADGSINEKKASTLFHRFLPRAEKTGDIDAPLIAGKKLCLDASFEKRHALELIYIVQLVVNAGGKYVPYPVESCDLFVNNASNNPRENIRLATAKSHGIPVITLKQLLEALGVQRDKLSEVPLPSVDLLMKYVKSGPPPKVKMTAGDGAPTTLREIFKSKGIVLKGN